VSERADASVNRKPRSRSRASGGSANGGAVRIGTRSSELALRQARLVQAALASRGVEAELVTFKTTGDKQLDQPLSAIGAKGLFTRELERALVAGRVDCCVHSLKDLPTESPEGLAIVALLEREDPRDVLVVNHSIVAEALDDLPRGSRVGTSSLRRRAQLHALRRDLDVVELRGNVPTRLRKVDEGRAHAAILAAAGLVRLGVRQRISAWLEPPDWLPAAGQGAIAVQARRDDARMTELLAPLHHAPTGIATDAERAFLAELEGGCQVPIGALVVPSENGLVLHGFISDVEGERVLRGETSVDPSCPADAGRRLAAELRTAGADALLAALRNDQKVPMPQPE
jgi:hydroxymethylbilane synthase